MSRVSLVTTKSLQHRLDKRHEKTWLEAAAAGGGGGVGGGEQGMRDSTAPTRHPTEEMEVDGADTSRDRDKEREDGAPLSTAALPTSTQGGGPGGKDPHPPGKKYRLTELMKAIVWELVMLSNECCRLENEKK